jgi:hypothetical protein
VEGKKRGDAMPGAQHWGPVVASASCTCLPKRIAMATSPIPDLSRVSAPLASDHSTPRPWSCPERTTAVGVPRALRWRKSTPGNASSSLACGHFSGLEKEHRHVEQRFLQQPDPVPTHRLPRPHNSTTPPSYKTCPRRHYESVSMHEDRDGNI